MSTNLAALTTRGSNEAIYEGEATVPKKILIVDDSEDTREMMAKLLELEAFSVITAKDGNAGLAVSADQHPDLIITDINMPNMNGIEMIKQLRTLPNIERIPIMAITAYGNGVAQEALDAGADSATTKPIQFGALIAEIRKLLASSRSLGETKGGTSQTD
jgi:CheY-like chemotaxis protein